MASIGIFPEMLKVLLDNQGPVPFVLKCMEKFMAACVKIPFYTVDTVVTVGIETLYPLHDALFSAALHICFMQFRKRTVEVYC